ncbi:MAG: SRPBCC family protein [Actinomycetota bacterium]
MRFENNLRIDRPVNEVFEFLAKFENIPRWNYAIVETRQVSDGPVGVGTTYRQVRSVPSRSEETFEVTEFEPPRRLSIRGGFGPLEGMMTYDLEPDEGGTRLKNSAQLEGRGLVKLAAPLASGRIAEAVAENLTALKQLLESS